MWGMLAAASGPPHLGTGWVWMTFTAGEGTRASPTVAPPACWASSTFCARTTVCRREARLSLRLLLRAVEGAQRSAATEDMLQGVLANRAGRERGQELSIRAPHQLCQLLKHCDWLQKALQLACCWAC